VGRSPGGNWLEIVVLQIENGGPRFRFSPSKTVRNP
jgi:hypothetical protein